MIAVQCTNQRKRIFKCSLRTLKYSLQHYLTMLGGTVSIPFILCPALCIEPDDPASGEILSTLFFVSGIATFLQTTFGVRLPIVQGGTFSFIIPAMAILALPENKCPDDFPSNGWGPDYNDTQKREEWQRRILDLQGAISVASIAQIIIGYFGIIGLMLNYITPLTVAPAVSMIGIYLFKSASNLASLNWSISMRYSIYFRQSWLCDSQVLTHCNLI